MALHDGTRATAYRVRGSASTLSALGRANAASGSGPAEYWTGQIERAAAMRARRGTTYTNAAYFAVDTAPVQSVVFVQAEEDTSGW